MSTVSVTPSARTIEDMVGRHHIVSFTYEIGREKVREFARAVHDRDLTHFDDTAARELGHDGIIAPVTFVSVVGTAVLSELFENLLVGYGIGDILHTDQQIVLHRPLRVGDVLASDLCLESFRRSSGSDIMVTSNDITDSSRLPVATTRTTFVARTGGNPDGKSFQDVLDGIMRGGG